MYGALLLFESEFVHIVAISFTSLILTELLMVALTIQTWHWLMIVAELLSLASYIASLVFLHEFIGEETSTHAHALTEAPPAQKVGLWCPETEFAAVYFIETRKQMRPECVSVWPLPD